MLKFFSSAMSAIQEALAAVNEAIKSTQTKNYTDAWAQIENVPEDSEIWTNLGAAKVRGICLWQGKRDMNAAQKWFARLVEQNPDDDDAKKYCDGIAVDIKRELFRKAQKLQAEEKISEAEEIYASISLEPPITDDIRVGIASNWGACLMGLGRKYEALQSFNIAIELKPDCLPAHFNRGLLFKSDNQFSEACIEFEEALKLKPTLAAALTGLLECFAQLHRSQDLLDLSTKILDENTLVDDFRPLFYRALAHYRMGAYLLGIDDAKKVFETYEQLPQPHQDRLISILVQCYKEHGDMLSHQDEPQNALQYYEKALEIVQAPQEASAVLLSKASALHSSGDSEHSKELLLTCIQAHPDQNKPFLEALGMLQLDLGQDLQEAKKNLVLGLSGELDPSKADSLFNLGMLQYKDCELNLALSTFQRILELDPFHERALVQAEAMSALMEMSTPEPAENPPPPAVAGDVPMEGVPTATQEGGTVEGIVVDNHAQFIASTDDSESRNGYTFRLDGPKGSGWYKTFIKSTVKDFDSQEVQRSIERIEEEHEGMYEFMKKGPLGPGFYQKKEIRRMKQMGWRDSFIKVKLRIAPPTEGDDIDTSSNIVVDAGAAGKLGALGTIERIYLQPDGSNIFTYAELTEKPFPEGVDPTKRELYLSDDEFSHYLHKTKEEWKSMPAWRKSHTKKAALLF